MKYEVEVATKDIKDEWNKYVKEKGTIFHLFEWSEVLESTYGYKPLYIYAINKDSICGILPAVITRNPIRKRIVSLPLVDYGGFIVDNEFIQNVLLNFILEICKKKSIVFECFTTNKIDSLNSYHVANTFILDTQYNLEFVWNNFNKKVRNSIRKSLRSGVVVEECDKSFISEYYKIYLETMKRLGVLPHSYKLFKNIINYFKDKVEIYSAKIDNSCIAGLIVFILNSRMYIWGNASRGVYLRYAPNNALYYYAIKRACELGVKYVDFGSTPLSSGHYMFKERWGGEPRQIYLSTSGVASKNKKNPLERLTVKIMPSILLNIFGEFGFKYVY